VFVACSGFEQALRKISAIKKLITSLVIVISIIILKHQKAIDIVELAEV